MIALSPQVKYIYEPFNISTEDPKPFVNWFEYVNANTDREHANVIAKYLQDKIGITWDSTKRNVKDIKSIGGLYKFLWTSWNNQSRRPLIKDPIAVMSADWLFKTFNMDVIVMIRHPAAFVASLKLKDWQFDFSHLANQGGLMDIIHPDFSEKVRAYAADPPGIIDQGILLWNIIYERISQYKKQFPSWLFIRHEDLSHDPIEEFRKIYGYLGLQYTEAIKASITYATKPEKESSFKRDSRNNILSWKNRLGPHEIDQIRKDTDNIGLEFYDDSYW